MNVKNLHEFDFLDKPPKENFLKAYEELISIGAIDNDVNIYSSKAKLTNEGKLMTILPLEPILSKIVLVLPSLILENITRRISCDSRRNFDDCCSPSN
jgi:HrpA-like RNA helicase